MREQHYFEIHNAELTHWWYCARRQIVANLITKLATTNRPLQIADIGCGTGASFAMLTRFGWTVGIDFSPLALSFSRTHGHLQLAAAALPSRPFQSDSFDIVCALDVIEHIENDADAMRELLRICKPNGLVILTVPAYQWLWSSHDDLNEHKRRYTRPQIQALLKDLPMTVERLSYMNILLAPPVIFYRQIKRLSQCFCKPNKPIRSDDFLPPRLLNWILRKVFAIEASWLTHHSLPFGTSVICAVRKHSN